MSIWCTTWTIDSDDHDVDACDRWVPCSHTEALAAGQFASDGGMHWLYDGHRTCTCAAGPLAYAHSAAIPSPEGDRVGSVDIATIAAHIGIDHEYRDEYYTHLPYVRLSLRDGGDRRGTVVLDRRHATDLLAALQSAVDHMDPEVTP